MKIINGHGYELPNGLEELLDEIYAHMGTRLPINGRNVEVALLDEGEIRHLNNLYRGKDRVTDVLSFPMNPDPWDEFLGAVYLCYPFILGEDRDPLNDIPYLFIHSILHLLGFVHGEEMFRLQEEIASRYSLNVSSL